MQSHNPVIVLKPTDLWRYRKDPVDWLRDERKTLQSRCRREAARLVALRIPSPQQAAAGEVDRWDDLGPTEQALLANTLFEQLVERSGATAPFVEKLLGRPIADYLLEAVMQRRAKLSVLWEQDARDPAELRQRVNDEARRALGAFLDQMPQEHWVQLFSSQQELRLAKLQQIVAERLGLSLAEVGAALEAPLDVLLHQEWQRREAAGVQDET